MPAVIPLPENELEEVKKLATYYVGTCGLTHAQAAEVINHEKKELFKEAGWNLKKNKVIGYCNRANVLRAETYSAEGRKMLKALGLKTYEPKPHSRTRPPQAKGMENRLKNAQLRAASQSSEDNAPVPEEDETQPTARHYRKSPGFISARERRQRGLTERESGAHMPTPSSDLSSNDIRFLERHLYKD